MSEHDALEEDWERAHPLAGAYEDEEFEEPSRRSLPGAAWWSGRTAAAVGLCAVGVVALGFTLLGAAKGDSQTAPYPALPSVVPPTSSAGEPASTAAEAREIVVSVVGAVRHPGLARLVPGARVSDALEAAGGLSPEAETSGLNLAQRLEDGDQVVVGGTTPVTPVPPAAPRKAPPAPPRAPDPRASSRCDCGGNRAPGSAPSGRKQTNVNTATEAELDAVPGIGKGIARAIVQYRAAHGRIRSLDELAKVKQIGAGRLKKLRPHLRV